MSAGALVLGSLGNWSTLQSAVHCALAMAGIAAAMKKITMRRAIAVAL